LVRITGVSILAVLGTLGCITARSRLPRAGDTETADALARAKVLFDKGDFDGAIKVANDALAGALDRSDVSRKTIASLTELVAHSAFEGGHPDAPTQFAAALSAWEKVPNSDEDVARVAGLNGLALVLMDVDLAGAEKQYRRSSAILERLHGVSDPALIMSLHYILDLLDQECRVTEFQGVLAHLEKIYDLHPGQDCAAFYRLRFHALAARRQGDAARAQILMGQAIAALEKTETDTHQSQAGLKRAAYELLGNIARDRGQYADAMRAAELGSAIIIDARDSEIYDSDYSLGLHFNYEAANDARLQSNDAKFHVRSARTGAPLFELPLPAIESCQPEIGPEPQGWVFRAGATRELIAHCFETETSPNAHVSVMMRVGSGLIVAAEAAGHNVDPAGLECASHAVLALPMPGPHDFNFVRDDWWYPKQ